MRYFAFVLLLSISAFALPVGNPANPALYHPDLQCKDPCNLFTWQENLSLRFGFYGDYCYNRMFYVDNSVLGPHNVQRFVSNDNSGVLTLNVCNNVQMSANVGTNTLFMHLNGGLLSSSDTLIDLFFDTNITWGVSAQGILWNPGNLFVGTGIQYQRRSPRLKRMLRYDTADIMELVGNNSATYEDWQVSLGMAYKYQNLFCTCTPFIGLKFSGGVFDFSNFDFTYQGTNIEYTMKTLRPKKLWGYALGIETVIGNRIGAAAEVRLADEKALTVNGTCRF